MANLLTVYDDDEANTVVDCTICNKRLTGETQYKVHLTTIQHFKKEEAQAAKGLIPKPLPLPEWTDIREYLQYLSLDEPIIGLSALTQEEDAITDDGKVQLRYRCKMCAVEVDMFSMVCHVVSRKHRQKYLQLKRPDLVTWHRSLKTSQKQLGLVARAKAALVEKKEGWGTPVALNRPNGGQRLKKHDQGHGTEPSHSYTHEVSYSGRDRRDQSPMAEDGYRQTYLEDDALERPYRYDEDEPYNRSSRDQAALRQSYPESERCEMTYQDGRQRSYQDYNHTEQPYLKGDISVRSFLEDTDSGRHDIDRTISARSYRDERQEERYPEVNLREAWNSGRDMQDDSYRGSVPGSRFTDTEMSGSARRIQDVDYREDKVIQGQRYTSHEGKGCSMDDIQRPRSFQRAEEKMEHAQYVESTRRAGSFEVKGYIERRRDDLRDYSQEHSPAKRKKKSRFSDATPLEIALTQKRLLEAMIPNTMNLSMEGPTKSQVSSYRLNEQRSDILAEKQRKDRGFQEIPRYQLGPRDFQGERIFTNSTSLQGNQRFEENSQVFEDKRFFEGRTLIQDMKRHEKDTYRESARYENLSSDFQESRRFQDDPSDFQQSRGFKGSPKDFQHGGHFENDPPSFRQSQEFKDPYKESARYEKLPGDFQDDRTSFQQSRGFKDDPKDFQHGGRFEDDSAGFRQTRGFKDSYQESARYESLSRDYQESRRFQDERTDFQQSRGLKDNPRDSKHGGRFEDDSDSFRQAREFKDNTRGFQRGGRFEDDSLGFQQARSYDESPRARQVDEEPRSFQNLIQSRGTETARGYEGYTRRAGVEGRYSEDDVRRSQSSPDGQRKYEWERRGTGDRSEDLKNYYSNDDDRRRGYQESLWASKPLGQDDKVYGESRAQRPHYQRDSNLGAELYDPFNPSTSSSPPPQEAAPPSSLEKLAATLLELVARKSN